MIKKATVGFIASLLMASGSAIAAEGDASLTTKHYVDEGLRAVYRTATESAAENAASITNLQTTLSTALGEEATRATTAETALDERLTTAESDIDELQETVNALDGVAYEGENGVYVEDHKVGLDVEAEEGEMYIYTSTGWSALPVQDTWDPSILTLGNNNNNNNNNNNHVEEPGGE